MNIHLSPLTKKLILLLAMALLACSALWAQTISGGGAIQGTVKDVTGAALPGAKITIRNIATNVDTNVVANDEGSFLTPSLPIGRYRIRVEATGMKAWQGEMTVETGRVAEINPALSVGDVSETVVIEGNLAPLVNVTDATVGSTLESQRIKELPINGRNINALLEDTVPGLEANFDVNGGVRAAGLMGYSTDYVQDGAASN
ncbi:MAG: carboxypeptidase regulatory-like domain-containing protein, partial [Blastocatellia bacterium]|nr:carboxypeptidase regulatory-like domain-containing protein [Blastocatellia bacterium]